MKKLLIVIFLGSLSMANQSLLFLEAQVVAGYNDAQSIYYSQDPDDSMQQSSIGFDFLQKLSGENGDYGRIALQARVNYVPNNVSMHLYNAYISFKVPEGYLWVGHSKPAMGLSSWLDTHASLLPTLTMKGFGYDRDWGIGMVVQQEDGEDAYSLTTGSGMKLISEGNYLLSGRKSWGVLNRDNSSLGLSVTYGKAYEVMGYKLMMHHPKEIAIIGLDHSLRWDNYEWLGEVFAGQKDSQNAYAAMGRFSVNLMEENRLKLEIQSLLTESYNQFKRETAIGATYLLTDDWTTRMMVQWNDNNPRIVLQAYYSGGL